MNHSEQVDPMKYECMDKKEKNKKLIGIQFKQKYS